MSVHLKCKSISFQMYKIIVKLLHEYFMLFVCMNYA